MDALSDVLKTVRFTGAIFFDVHASEPWVADTPQGEAIVGTMFPGSEHLICYHVITEGNCWACIAGEPPIRLSAGDIIVYIAPDVAISVRASVDLGNGHRISSELPDIHINSEGDQWGPRTLTAEGKLNGGGPVLKVRTTSGDICFKRAN